MTAASLNGLHYGFGRHVHELTLDNVSDYLKGFYTACFAYQTGLGLTKASVLLFYRRIFPTRFVKASCWVLGILILIYTISQSSKSPSNYFWR